MRKYNKLTDDEIKDLVLSNPQAGKLLSSLREYISPEIYQKVMCPDQKMASESVSNEQPRKDKAVWDNEGGDLTD